MNAHLNHLENNVDYLTTLSNAFEIVANLVSFAPTRELVGSIQDIKTLENLNMNPENLSEKARNGFNDLSESIAQISATNPEEAYQRLATDYTRLFLGLRKKSSPFPPCESLFKGSRRLMMGKPAEEVVRSYAENGFKLSDEFKNPPDHLGAELLFIGYLLSKQADSVNKNDQNGLHKSFEEAKQFIDAHPRSWIEKYCDMIYSHDPHPFYKAILELTQSLLEEL